MCVCMCVCAVVQAMGGSRILGKGGSDKYIHNWGTGVSPPVTARESGGALIAPPVGSGVKPQPLFCF